MMSRQGTDFLYNWIRQHLTDADRGGDSTRAMVLADKCREAAAAQGLAVDDEPDWENLESIIYSKMHPSYGEEQRSAKIRRGTRVH
jgi:hypothetical protein